jgi:hypothetical protein
MTDGWIFSYFRGPGFNPLPPMPQTDFSKTIGMERLRMSPRRQDCDPLVGLRGSEENEERLEFAEHKVSVAITPFQVSRLPSQARFHRARMHTLENAVHTQGIEQIFGFSVMIAGSL